MRGDSSGATQVGVATTVAGASAATWRGSQQAPAFIKHVFAQLFPVMYEADAAEAVVASKGPRVRQQLDAGEAKRDVGATVVALTFNDPQKALPVPADCTIASMYDTEAKRSTHTKTAALETIAESSATIVTGSRKIHAFMTV
ncbi:hypothetical protein I4F81_010020 [Pyropia yezoensis]|uniref:Uncharacterized protein n=1 Tax=Pyropia yezoensis TaxID=2788 RepID=A0ACC3CCG5_PYRYE|nr:hypothetical protein I4F81_010020 [Neopyropia yezoensis]